MRNDGIEVKCPTAGAIFCRAGGGSRLRAAPLSTVLSMVACAAHCLHHVFQGDGQSLWGLEAVGGFN